MANVLAELTEQLAKKVGGEDIAKGIVEGFQMQKGATRSSVQKQVRGLIGSIDTDDAIRQAKIADQFAEGADGQISIKGLMGDVSESSTVHNAAEQVSSGSDAISGQISMFQDSTGQMHTPDSKMRQIKEARSASSRGKMESHLRDGADGQMYMDFGGMKDPSTATVKSGGDDVVSKAVDNTPIDGQQSFMVDKNGNLNTEEGVRQMRQAEVDKANRNWVRRRLDSASEAFGNLKNNISDTITGTGDGSRRIAGRNTREAARQAANQAYVETGQGKAQSRREFFKNYKPETPSNQAPSSNASDYTNILGASSASNVAEQNATGGINWSGIGEWAHDNQLIVAGGIAGGAILTSSLLDDDY